MVYTPEYTTEALVRLETDIATTSISSDDGKDLIKKGENRIDAWIQRDNIDIDDWGGTTPDLVIDAATYLSAAEWLRKIRTKFGGESDEIKEIIKEYVIEGKRAWQEYLDSINVTRGEEVIHTLVPRVKVMDEEEFREVDD